MTHVVAVDVGGTSMKAARLDRSGAVLESRQFPTPASEGPDAVVAAVRSAVRTMTGPDAVAVGLVVPGVVDVAAGVARYAANLGWREVPLARLIAEDTGRPVTLEHDVRAAGLAERSVGGLRDVADGLVVVIGTGIAGVIVTGGASVRGAVDLAGEIGHVPVHPDGEQCACGQRGCLETYASAASIARRYAARAGTPRSSAEIVARLGSDPDADAVWAEATRALALALTTATMLLDPAVVVLSGGLSAAGAALRDPVAAGLDQLLAWRAAPRVELSPLGGQAGLHGAALLAWAAAGV